MSRLVRCVAVLAALLLSAVGSVPAGAGSIEIGPKVGTKIPAPLSFRSADGAAKGFADVVGEKGVVMVFTRSAAWCPFCQAQMKELKSIVPALADKGYRLVTVSYDEPEVLAAFSAKNAIPYIMLSDKGSVAIDAFGIRDPQYKEGSKAYGVPQPAIFIVGRDGVVRAKLAEEGFKVRPSPEAVLAAVTDR